MEIREVDKRPLRENRGEKDQVMAGDLERVEEWENQLKDENSSLVT